MLGLAREGGDGLSRVEARTIKLFGIFWYVFFRWQLLPLNQQHHHPRNDTLTTVFIDLITSQCGN